MYLSFKKPRKVSVTEKFKIKIIEARIEAKNIFSASFSLFTNQKKLNISKL
jgi:hypothetical protein